MSEHRLKLLRERLESALAPSWLELHDDSAQHARVAGGPGAVVVPFEPGGGEG
ncbi:MAG: hypothetical protein RL603_521, partial [Pseudomonadota bacterium]